MTTWSCSTASTETGIPLRPAASSLAETPSTTKLLEKLRWLATERPLPGTAEVSAKSWVLAVFVGETPGTRRARSRKLRPFIGSDRVSALETVPASWLRAASRTTASLSTVTLSARATSRVTGTWNAAPAFTVIARAAGRKPGLSIVSS